ncbi:efflux RND transporter periplasmic adaptor subunit [Listeria booriae]|uniref:efflux RND transporter periplasmic adaptor subunit n=1 Tax=Listeria booriae TaxID=1552123 RepID=UPI001625A171|nr:HlyD family efflux transporter periplasmic adaptor subunit [Listeria booriae]MBC2173873.1 HlyD family efflux transporter periplasmic adaptor subunit [Listeria booriae]
MKKWVKWLIALVIIAMIGVGGIFFLYFNSVVNTVTTKDLVMTKVKQGNMKINATATGAIVPKNQQAPDYNELQLQVQMDELDVPNVKINQEVKISVTAMPDKKYTGKVKEIAEQGTVLNGVSSFLVTISIDDITDLKAGMTADASIFLNEKAEALYIPIEAIQKNDDGKYYVLVPKKEKNDTVKEVEKYVTAGLHNEDIIEITKGLGKGDEIILPTKMKLLGQMGF